MNLRRFLAEAAALAASRSAVPSCRTPSPGRSAAWRSPASYPNATKVREAGGPGRPAFEETAAGPATAAPDLSQRTPDSPVAATATSPGPGGTSPAEAAPRVAVPAQVAPARPCGGAERPAATAAELLGRFPAHGQPFVEITGEAAAWLHARGALFLDARRSKDFASGHVAGARSFPVWESDVVKERIEALVAEGRDTSLPGRPLLLRRRLRGLAHARADALRGGVREPPRLPGRVSRLGEAGRAPSRTGGPP